MLSYIQQYVIYILAGIILVAGIAITVQTIRLSMCQKDLVAVEAKLATANAVNATNKGTLDQMKTESDALQGRLAKAQNDIIYSERKHTETIKKLLTELPSPPSGKCDEMVEWAKKIAIRRDK